MLIQYIGFVDQDEVDVLLFVFEQDIIEEAESGEDVFQFYYFIMVFQDQLLFNVILWVINVFIDINKVSVLILSFVLF